jgi:hypothetical protein
MVGWCNRHLPLPQLLPQPTADATTAAVGRELKKNTFLPTKNKNQLNQKVEKHLLYRSLDFAFKQKIKTIKFLLDLKFTFTHKIKKNAIQLF